MSEPHHSIKLVARRTGLTSHVIRVWERRYGAVRPARTDTNRRLYSDADIERLSLLRRAIQAGHSIGNIASLPGEQLQRLAEEYLGAPPQPKVAGGAEQLMRESLEAIRQMDSVQLDAVLRRGVLVLGQHGLLEKLIGPLAQRIGDLWREGNLTAAQEHFASAVIKAFLARSSNSFSATLNAPVMVVTTPAGQLHEIGAVMVAAAAGDVGWRTVYLGPSLPAGEIAAAAVKNDARAVALSIVYPEDDPSVPGELQTLRDYLPAATHLVVGGRAAASYKLALQRVGAAHIENLKELYAKLDEWRRPSR
jgi:MerR family transcriptional regulator, light-induced transcriptional regulator